ncbi:hypothetical protein AaE_012200 [Aphanomyces astaci]|uniref:Uncharacterized protein n=2 Tax=Aphanomyces astaci TaxID=112090 RepID=A0A6A4ZHR4_APHAT|nr:hypothetical protein AaE_012200 [Aphanomyces astaci]
MSKGSLFVRMIYVGFVLAWFAITQLHRAGDRRGGGAAQMVRKSRVLGVSVRVSVPQPRIQSLVLLPQQRLLCRGVHGDGAAGRIVELRVLAALFMSNKNAQDPWTYCVRMYLLYQLSMAVAQLLCRQRNQAGADCTLSARRSTLARTRSCFFYFSHGLYVYLGGVVLITRNGLMLFGNSVVVYLTTTTHRLDGISLNMFDSTLVRNYPSLAIVIFVNLFVVFSVDGLVHHQWRRLL